MKNKKDEPNHIYLYILIGVILLISIIVIILSPNNKSNKNNENTDYINMEINADKIVDIDEKDLKDLKYYIRDNKLYLRNISKNEPETLYAENVKDIKYSNGYINVVLYENGKIIKDSTFIRYEYEDGFSNRLLDIEKYALEYFKKYDKADIYDKDYEFIANAELDMNDENIVYVEVSHIDGDTNLLDVKYTIDYTFLKGTSSLGKEVDFSEFK